MEVRIAMGVKQAGRGRTLEGAVQQQREQQQAASDKDSHHRPQLPVRQPRTQTTRMNSKVVVCLHWRSGWGREAAHTHTHTVRKEGQGDQQKIGAVSFRRGNKPEAWAVGRGIRDLFISGSSSSKKRGEKKER